MEVRTEYRVGAHQIYDRNRKDREYTAEDYERLSDRFFHNCFMIDPNDDTYFADRLVSGGIKLTNGVISEIGEPDGEVFSAVFAASPRRFGSTRILYASARCATPRLFSRSTRRRR